MAIKKCMSCGGSMKRMQEGGNTSINKNMRKEKSTIDALYDKQGKLLTKKQFATAQSKRKMQEGGIPPAPSRMQYIEAEKLKNKKKYYTPDNIYIGDPKKKKEIDAMIERKTKANTKGMDFSGKKKMAMGGSIAAGIPYKTGAGATDGKNGMMRKGGSTKKIKPPFEKGKFNVTGQKPFASLGSKLGLGTGVAGIVGVAGKALADKIKSRREEKKKLNSTAKPIAKKGGMVKAKYGATVSSNKFAALAPPYDKATYADKIVGAKRKASKK